MKKLLFALAALIAAVSTAASAARPSGPDRNEPDDPNPTDTAAWRGIVGTHASFGSTDMRYPRSMPYAAPAATEMLLTGWRGETLSAQAVVWTADGATNLRCSVGDFTASNGRSLRGIGRARFVKYVLSDRFLPDRPCGARPADNPAILSPDLLDEDPALDIAGRTTRPVWITVTVPADAAPGDYRAEVTLQADGGYEERLTLRLEVIDRLLPPAEAWNYRLDLWQHPSVTADIEGVEVWSDEHFRLMEPTMRLLASAGQKVITATVNKDPWNCQTEYPYADMIQWHRQADGGWSYDFSIFDRWVEFMMGLGIDRAINCYSLLPWNYQLHYIDDATGATVDVTAAPATPQFRAMWTPFLQAFTEHLRAKGWLAITNIAMDERSDADMDAAVALLAEAAPELGIALADDKFIFRKYPHIKDMCVGIFADMDREDIIRRRAEGRISTYYVCCSSGFPNTYTSSDPAEAVYLSWFALARDYDGFLRWSYNSWTKDPLRDTRFRTWAAGDTYIVYPGGRSSIRFERFREGIQDWEKATRLRRELEAAGTAEAKEQLAELDAAIARFASRTPFDGWLEALNDAKRLLNELAQ